VLDAAWPHMSTISLGYIDWIGEIAGFIERICMHYSPYSFGLFLAQIFCLVLSPVFFAGVNYVLFSRIARIRMQENSRLHRLTSYTFIASDIVTFLVQSAGGALFASADYNVVQIGGKILLSGLVLQLVSVTGFCVWMGRFDFWVARNPGDIGTEYETEWNRICISRWISIIGILIRAIYRVTEYVEGRGGYLLTHEAFLYCLDSTPIFFATAIFAVPGHFPGRLLTMELHAREMSGVELVQRTAETAEWNKTRLQISSRV